MSFATVVEHDHLTSRCQMLSIASASFLTTMNNLKEYLLLGGAMSAVVLITYVPLHRWICHREFENYRNHGGPSDASRSGDYQHFLALWRRYRENQHTYFWPHPSRAGSKLTLGAYLRSCELAEASGNHLASPPGRSGVGMKHSNSTVSAQASNAKQM